MVSGLAVIYYKNLVKANHVVQTRISRLSQANAGAEPTVVRAQSTL